eukprot:GHVU01012349.1.p2 GENE.GHVU01012349.1~~GHVU01012349.1.p2  ORF type:complete len:134 (-),score=12.43 GHVU01012349.1:3777-4178(-)
MNLLLCPPRLASSHGTPFIVLRAYMFSLVAAIVFDFLLVPSTVFKPESDEKEPLEDETARTDNITPNARKEPFDSARSAILSPYFILLVIYAFSAFWRRMHYLAYLGPIYTWASNEEEGKNYVYTHNTFMVGW